MCIRQIPIALLCSGLLLGSACFGAGGDDDPVDAGNTTDGGTITDGGGSDGGPTDGGGGPCTTGDRRCAAPDTAQLCDDQATWTDVPCATGTGCTQGLCLERICQPGDRRCVLSDTTLETCDVSGTTWVAQTCPVPGACVNQVCEAYVCTPDEARCVTDSVAERCASDGSGWIATNCSAAERCWSNRCLVPVCDPGEVRCIDLDTAEVCAGDGSGYTQSPCPQPGACVNDACVTYVCTPNTRRCTDAFSYETCASDGSGWVNAACPSPQYCATGGTCTDPVCTPNATSCQDATTLETCRADGSGFDTVSCGTNKVCSGGACLDSICTPFERRCVDGSTVETCALDGTGWVTTACPTGSICTGAGSCATQICSPGETGCYDTTTRGLCNADGTGWLPSTSCTGGSVCSAGTCVSDPCTAAATEGSPAGCAFTTVVTPGTGSGAGEQIFGIVNPGTTSATVTFTAPGGGINPVFVSALTSTAFETVLAPAPAGTNVSASAWTITSTQPVVLFQGSPVTTQSYLPCSDFFTCQLLLSGTCDSQNNCTVCDSNGQNCDPVVDPAGHGSWSWIRPHHGLGETYVVAAWPHLRYENTGSSPSIEDWPWAITIAATAPGTTLVTLDVGGGYTASGGTIGQANPGQALLVSLTRGQVARIESRAAGTRTCASAGTDLQICEYAGDLSGTKITASAPVAVLVGSVCGRAQSNVAGCDAVEEFLPPYEALGTVHVAGPSIVGSYADRPSIFKVVATKDNTTLTYDPVTIAGGIALQAGESDLILTGEPFVVSATAPVLVMKVATGRDQATSTLDPSIAFLPPVGQWRRQGALHVPGGFAGDTGAGLGEVTLTVVGPAPGTHTLDGTTVSVSPIGSSGYGYSLHTLSSGYHTVDAPVGIGASLLGGAKNTSFLGGSVSYGVGTSAIHGVKALQTDTPDLP